MDQDERVRVLVVDDEPSIVAVISMALRHHGFRVEAAASGQEALDQARRWRPHVMVLDVMLPDMEGFEVARRLSAEHVDVPILFLSARDTTADKVRGLTTGGDDYVTKPFSLEELIARLRNILRRAGAALGESLSRLTFADVELDEDTFEDAPLPLGRLARAPHPARLHPRLRRALSPRRRRRTEEAMTRIEGEATRMGVLVENLLLLARLDEMPELRLEPVDLRELAERAAEDTRALAPQRGVRLTANDAVWALADPEQLRQVLANMTRNPVMHTPAETVIDITLRREGERAVLQVRDHGPGLPADAGDRVFDRFWRADAGRSRGRGGAGLGLAIVKAIVQAHHGEVHAGNAPDGGAVFRVVLPITQGSQRAGAPKEPAARA